MSLKAAELFAGYGGLALAVEEVFGAETTWFSEFDAAPSRILAHHWPNVPNYGDVTKIDFTQVPHVDIISGGSPCQDLSAAGRRKGMTDGTRSNLWVQMREAIATIKPTYVVWENVRGAYSAEAYSELEHCPGCLGNPADRGTVLRALGRVLGDLSDLGYDCQWRGLRAADVGAPHGRFRVFILATKNTDLTASGERRESAPRQEEAGRAWADASRRSRTSTPDAHSGECDGWERDEVRSQEARVASAWGCDVLAADSSGSALRELPGGSPTEEAGPTDSDRPRDHRGEQHAWDGRTTTADAAGPRCSEGQDRRAGGSDASPRAWSVEPQRIGGERTSTNWGVYDPGIRRWESALGRRAPAPTEPTGRNGKHRLSPRFCEWMMGVPDGWIVDVPGISRNEAIKAAGNGVVPQQAATALRDMLNHTHERRPTRG